MNLISRNYPDELVLKVNELYHDLYFQFYHSKHSDKMDCEKPRWKRVGEQFFSSKKQLTILDLGSGTGFVPLTTAIFLKVEDIFICSDVSDRMLKEAKKNIEACDFNCRFRYVKLVPEVATRLPFESRSVDIITLNSVLHHIKDTNSFLNEIDRLLKNGGLLLIGHEPNSYYLGNRYLRLISGIANPRSVIDEYAIKYSVVKSLKEMVRNLFIKKRQTAAEHVKLTAKINEKLIGEKIIEKELLPEEIKIITDIRAREGFQPDKLLDGYKILYLETYNYLDSIAGGYGFWARSYEKVMSKIFPRLGATFFVVLKKKPN